jgi:DHA2 family multidrug resistance protein-like MFS transporter
MSESPTVEAAAPPRPAEDNGLPVGRRRLALTALYSALVLVVVDGAVVNVALPTIGQALRVGSAASVAVATSYQLAVVISLLPFAALGESIGPRRVFIGGAALFIAASGFCAAAPTLGVLIAARFLQGFGGGAIMALSAMLLRFTMPKDRLAHAIGWNAVAVALAGAAGPSIGALILSVASWPWLFAVNLPIGVLALVAARALPAVPGSGHRVDAISAAASAGLFTLFFVGAGRIAEQPLLGLGLILAAALCLIGLVRRERGHAAPLVPVDLFAERAFRRTVLASGATFCAQMMSGIALPFHLQRALGASVLATGVYMSAWPIAIVASASFSGRLAGRAPAPALCAVGTSVLAFALLLSGLAPTAAGVAPILALMALAGLGFGVFQPANNRLLLLSAPKSRSGAAGGVQATTRLVGQTLGATAMTALFQLAPGDVAPRLGLVVSAGFALLAAIIGAVNARHIG